METYKIKSKIWKVLSKITNNSYYAIKVINNQKIVILFITIDYLKNFWYIIDDELKKHFIYSSNKPEDINIKQFIKDFNKLNQKIKLEL